MTNYDEIDFSPIQALTEGEVITHSRVRDITLPSGKVLALITLDNGRDHTRPNTLGPATMTALGETLDVLRGRARNGEIDAVGVTGKQYILAAGADLSDITKVGSQAWTVGAKIYWDDTNKRCTTVATDNTLIGVAVEAVASGAGDTIGRVRLNATF